MKAVQPYLSLEPFTEARSKMFGDFEDRRAQVSLALSWHGPESTAVSARHLFAVQAGLNVLMVSAILNGQGLDMWPCSAVSALQRAELLVFSPCVGCKSECLLSWSSQPQEDRAEALPLG